MLFRIFALVAAAAAGATVACLECALVLLEKGKYNMIIKEIGGKLCCFVFLRW